MANQISVLLDPAQMPNQSQDQTTFDNLWAAVLAALPTFGAQFNAAIANVNASLNGVGLGIPYTVDLTSTADGDPGNGKIRFGSATQNASTVLRLDLLSSNTGDYTAWLDTFDASTSTVKGRIGLVKQGDAKTFLIFDVTARATATGYRNITVTPVASSSANPFGQGDAVLLFFQRTGDKGNQGTTGYAKFADRQAAGTNAPASLAGGLATRTLNTVVANTFGATLSANSFTLPVGTYVIQARAPAMRVDTHRIAIKNTTDNTITEYGTNACESSGGAYDTQTDSIAWAYVTLSAAKSFVILHATEAAYQWGLGKALNSSTNMGGPEVYTEVSVWKLS